MFTGLVEDIGIVADISPLNGGIQATFMTAKLSERLALGDSVSINGVCSTAHSVASNSFKVDYLEETLKKTNLDQLSINDCVNLELSVTPTTKMGGHFVSGHVDSTGTVVEFEKGNPWGKITIEYPETFRPLIVSKGSISLNGISLTVVDPVDNCFSCHLIPHSLAHTSLKNCQIGDQVNLEFDMIGKYLHHFYTLQGGS